MAGRTTPIGLESLLREQSWLRGLARSLVADASAADDLVQDAWVATLRRPPSGTGRTQARAYFATILRRLAGAGARREANRRERERVAARSEAVAPESEALERLSLQRGLAEAVLELREPYRQAIVLRFVEGLEPSAIARRLGESPQAVRTRISRGLAMLRERLDRESGGDRGAWSTMLLGPTTRRGTESLVAASALGGVVVTWKLLSAAVIVVLAALSWMWLSRAPRAPLSPRGAPEIAASRDPAAAAEIPHGERAPAPEPVADPEPFAVPTDAPPPESAVPPETVEIVVTSPSGPVVRADVELVPRTEPFFEDARVRAEAERRLGAGFTDDHGLVRFPWDGTSPHFARVRTDAGHSRVFRFAVTQDSRRFVLELGTAGFRGTIYDDDGKPIVEARIYCALARTHPWAHVDEVHSGPDGVYEIVGLTAGTYELYAYVEPKFQYGQTRIGMATVTLQDAVRTLDFGAPRPPRRWSGALRTSGGSALEVSVQVSWTEPESGREGYFDTRSDGTFEEKLQPGRYVVSVYGAGVHEELVVTDSDLVRDLVIPGICLRGTLRYVGAHRGEIHYPAMSVWLKPSRRTFVGADAGGAWEFLGLAPGTYALSMHPQRIVGVAGPNGLEITLDGSREIVTLDLDVDDP